MEEVTPGLSLGDTEGFTRQRGRKRHQVKYVQRHQGRHAVVVLLDHGYVCVGVFTHTCACHEEAEGKGPARDKLVGLDQEGGLVCHAKELGVYPKATGSY